MKGVNLIPKMGGGNVSLKLGKVASDFDSRFGENKSHWGYSCRRASPAKCRSANCHKRYTTALGLYRERASCTSLANFISL